MERKYDFIEVTLDNDNYKFIKEIYRLYKEQANKIFDLACGISTDEDIMDYIKNNIEYNITLLGIDTTNGEYAGVVVLDDVCVWDDEVTRANCHIVVGKKYWGKGSRELINDCYKFLKENMKKLNRLEAFVPSNNFGIIKLLKDVGFKIEGTLKNRLLFKNKKGEPTHYNELVYSNTSLGE